MEERLAITSLAALTLSNTGFPTSTQNVACCHQWFKFHLPCLQALPGEASALFLLCQLLPLPEAESERWEEVSKDCILASFR